MARKPVISRKFTLYSTTVIVADKETAEVAEVTYKFNKNMKPAKLAKEIAKHFGEGYVVIKYSEPVAKEVKMAMDLNRFIELADVIE